MFFFKGLFSGANVLLSGRVPHAQNHHQIGSQIHCRPTQRCCAFTTLGFFGWTYQWIGCLLRILEQKKTHKNPEVGGRKSALSKSKNVEPYPKCPWFFFETGLISRCFLWMSCSLPCHVFDTCVFESWKYPRIGDSLLGCIVTACI